LRNVIDHHHRDRARAQQVEPLVAFPHTVESQFPMTRKYESLMECAP
jgi:hypothetical protein